MRKIETRVRARYAETDQMGIVHHVHYLVWMEAGRVAYCSRSGFKYRDMEREDGVTLPVTEALCQYRAPARFDDEVQVLTWVIESRSRAIRFGYEMRRADDRQLLARGETLHLVCDSEGKPARLPEKYRPFFPLRPRPTRPRLAPGG